MTAHTAERSGLADATNPGTGSDEFIDVNFYVARAIVLRAEAMRGTANLRALRANLLAMVGVLVGLLVTAAATQTPTNHPAIAKTYATSVR
jgi:hypothetical protein